MKKLYSEKIPYGSIITMEGFWGAGKSTLITKICKKYDLKYISEPNHEDNNIERHVSEWYEAQHNSRLLTAKRRSILGESSIMERSVLANIAFYYANNSILPLGYEKIINKFINTNNFKIVFLIEKSHDLREQVKNIKNASIRRRIQTNDKFYDRYIYFYTKILSKLLGQKILIVRHEKNDSNINDKMYLKLRKLLNQSCRNISSRPDIDKHVCAGGIVLYGKNKCLALYDHNYRHFIFPQGHRMSNEKLVDAAIREIKEETGFCKLKFVSTVGKYSYGYKNNSQMIYKTVHVFLFLLESLQKHKKKFELHEKYSNYFFPFNVAIKKLKWPEDRNMLVRVINILNNKKTQAFGKQGL